MPGSGLPLPSSAQRRARDQSGGPAQAGAGPAPSLLTRAPLPAPPPRQCRKKRGNRGATLVRALVALVLVGAIIGWVRAHGHKKELHTRLSSTAEELGSAQSQADDYRLRLAQAENNVAKRGRELQDAHTTLSRVQQELNECRTASSGDAHQ